MRRRILIIAVVLACHLQALCQYTEARRVDSLKIENLKELLPTLKDTARIKCLNSISEKYRFFYASGGFAHRYDSIYYYASKAYNESQAIGYKYGIAYSLLNMASSAKNKSQQDSNAKNYILQAMRLGEEIHNDKITGWAYYLLAGYADRIENWKKSVHYFHKSNDPREGEVSTWLCMFYSDKGEYENGFDYCQKGLQLTKLNASTEWGHELVQWSLFNMAVLYKVAGDYETAMSYLTQSRQHGKVYSLDWRMEDQIGKLFILMNQPDSAIYYLQRFNPTCYL